MTNRTLATMQRRCKIGHRVGDHAAGASKSVRVGVYGYHRATVSDPCGGHDCEECEYGCEQL
jgi:hypothetical protein